MKKLLIIAFIAYLIFTSELASEYKREGFGCYDHSAHAYTSNLAMGKARLFKYPHYYGYGVGNGFHYGEPYYVRTVKY